MKILGIQQKIIKNFLDNLIFIIEFFTNSKAYKKLLFRKKILQDPAYILILKNFQYKHFSDVNDKFTSKLTMSLVMALNERCPNA